MLVAALCELKSRLLVDAEADDEEELDAEGAAEELAQRLAEYQRFKRAAELARRAPRRRGPARLPHDARRRMRRRGPSRRSSTSSPARLAEAMLHLLEPPERVDTTTIRRRAVAMRPFVERFRLLVRARGGFVFDDEVAGLERGAQAAAFVALLELIKRGEARAAQADLFEPIRVARNEGTLRVSAQVLGCDGGRGVSDALVAACEALLFVAERAAAAARDRRCRRGRRGGRRARARRAGAPARGARSGRRARPHRQRASACARRPEARPRRPAACRRARRSAASARRRSRRSPWWRTCSRSARPEIARIRGVSSDAVVAGLLERELIEEAGRGDGLGAPVLYRTTTIFERIFGLEEGIDGLPGLDGDEEVDSAELRQRLHAVAAERG